MIGKYDPDVVQNLMPLIVNVLGKHFPYIILKNYPNPYSKLKIDPNLVRNDI